MMQKLLNKNLPFALSISFLIFYSIQIPEYTCKNDVILFSARSLQAEPVLNYAYLDSTTLLFDEVLPNYHFGHTIILWLYYKIIPEGISNTIWQAGFLAAVAGSLSIWLTYLISITLNFTRKTSLTIAIIYGIIPIIWEHSVIGELYSLQMLFTLLFLYAFLQRKYLISVFAFFIANTISPLSALAITFCLLDGINRKNVFKALSVALGALILYMAAFFLLDFNISALFGKVSEVTEGRGIIYRILILGIFVLINFHFFLYYFVSGFSGLFKHRKKLALALIIGALPQILLVFLSAGFFIEKGSFQILLFWAMSIPVGLAISELKKPSFYLIISFILSAVITYSLMIYPHYSVGSSLAEAGKFLKNENYDDLPIIGAYGASINILKYRDGLSLDAFNRSFYDFPMPAEDEIIQTGEKAILIAHHKKTPLRKMISKLGISGLKIQNYNPDNVISIGKIDRIFDNEAVTIYRWEK